MHRTDPRDGAPLCLPSPPEFGMTFLKKDFPFDESKLFQLIESLFIQLNLLDDIYNMYLLDQEFFEVSK